MSTVKNKITEGNISKEIFFFFIPIVISAFFQHFYSFVDAMIVGQNLGDLAFAAVGGSSAKLITLFINFFVGVSAGITVYTSRFFGSGDMAGVKKIIYNGSVSFILFGIVLSIIALLFGTHYLEVMDTPQNTMDYSKIYLDTFMYGLVFCILYNMFSGVFRALGDAKTPLYVLIFCSFLNIILDLVFVILFKWGVFGVAFATLLAQGLSAFILVFILHRKFRYEEISYSLDFTMIADIYKLGIPAGIQSIMYSLSNMLVQSSVNTFGYITVTAWSAYLKIDSIVDIFVSSLAGTVITFVGQNLGANKIARVKESVIKVILISYSITLILAISFVIFRFPLLDLFKLTPEVTELAASFFFIIMPMYLIGIPYNICAQAVRGLGKSFEPMIITLVGVVGLRFIWVLFIFPLYPNIHFLAACYPVSSFIMTIIFVCYYKKEIKIVEEKLQQKELN